MRSLMASNPFQTARESLLSLFDENRKKVCKLKINLEKVESLYLYCVQFELIEKKRKEEQATEEKERQQEKEAMGKGLRREIWIHPDNSSKEWLTPADDKSADWREEELIKISFTELNRQFLTSYLHVQGKLFTKIGYDIFSMLKTLPLK